MFKGFSFFTPPFGGLPEASRSAGGASLKERHFWLQNMFFLYRYKKYGLPYGLIKLHEFLLEDIIVYFEKGKFTRKRVKEARKAVKQALRFAKKKKIYPSIKTDRANELLEELLEEVEYTHQVLKETATEMESMITLIKEERVGNVPSLINTAREHFRNNELEKGMELLRESQGKLGINFLLKTREKVLAGIGSEVKKIKYEIQTKRKQSLG